MVYTVARNILGWSDVEFWQATPRKYYAQYYTFISIKNLLTPEGTKGKPLEGKMAIQELKMMAKKYQGRI